MLNDRIEKIIFAEEKAIKEIEKKNKEEEIKKTALRIYSIRSTVQSLLIKVLTSAAMIRAIFVIFKRVSK